MRHLCQARGMRPATDYVLGGCCCLPAERQPGQCISAGGGVCLPRFNGCRPSPTAWPPCPAARRRARGTRTLTRSSCVSTRSSQRWVEAAPACPGKGLSPRCGARRLPAPRQALVPSVPRRCPPLAPMHAACRSRTSRRLSWGGLRWRLGTTRRSRQSTATAGCAPQGGSPRRAAGLADGHAAVCAAACCEGRTLWG